MPSLLVRRALLGSLALQACSARTPHLAIQLSKLKHPATTTARDFPELKVHPKTQVVVGEETWDASSLILPQSSAPVQPWKHPVEAFLLSFSNGYPLGMIHLDRSVFAANYPRVRQDLIYRALRYEESWREQGTESSKSRSMVRGSSRKAFPQKGRGRARVGTLRATQFVGGYAAHGPRPHNKAIDIPRQMYHFAVRSAISAKFAQDQVVIVDSLTSSDYLHSNSVKKDLIEKLTNLKLEGKKLYLVYGSEEPSPILVRLADQFTKKREPNLERPLFVTQAREISVTPIMEAEVLVLDKEAVEVLESMYHFN
ncbi:ribosomal protein L4/L1 family-domain-containing protein [Cladochytrium replicatum]|nr:ribosomal protein L4/L1 family-domain-containing protein [Cladochytrium replicatum]